MVDSGYQAPTRLASDVIRQVTRQFGDESGMQLETADIIGWINDGQRDIADREHILKGKASIAATVNQGDYRFPNVGILSVDSIHFAGSPLPNVTFSQAEADYLNGGNGNATGTPQIWYEWAGQFTFWPAPDTADTIDIYFSQIPTAVSLQTDTLGIPDKWFNTLVHYVLQQAYEMDEDWQASQAKQQSYNDSLTAIGDEEREAANMTYETITRTVGW